MQEITIKDYSKRFCNNYKERWEDVPDYITTSAPDINLKLICRFSEGKKSIFEFGTWIGRSAFCFSQNYEKVETIDFLKGSDIDYSYDGKKPGHYVKGKQNVKVHLHDSNDFNFSGYEDKFDCVFVDGNHGSIPCFLDLNNATKICKSNGLIFLDDYFWKNDSGEYVTHPWMGVKDAVDRLISLGYKEIYRIKDTMLVFFVNKWNIENSFITD